MTCDQLRDEQMRQTASGVIDTADPIWRADDRPTVWDRIREVRDRCERPIEIIVA